MFSGFDRILECDRHTDTQTHDDDIYHVSIASLGKKYIANVLMCNLYTRAGRDIL